MIKCFEFITKKVPKKNCFGEGERWKIDIDLHSPGKRTSAHEFRHQFSKFSLTSAQINLGTSH